jgi:peptide/nickel transport system ATP-binding protein
LSAIPQIDVRNREIHKAQRRAVEQEYQLYQKDYYDENGRVYDLVEYTSTHQVALNNGGVN